MMPLMNQILTVDMTRGKVIESALAPEYELLGGRALTARLLMEEGNAPCNPLGPSNLLILACGLLAGTLGSAMNRASVGCKSPLTGGVKESNVGGTTALRLAQLGFRAIVIRGAPLHSSSLANGDKTSFVLVIREEGRHELVSTPELHGKGTFETALELQRRFGADIGIAVIGPAGDFKLTGAGINHLDTDRLPTRLSARGGVGAVMGSKGLKAIVLHVDRRKKLPFHQAEKWNHLVGLYNEALRSDPGSGERLPLYGTAAALEYVNALGGLPTRGFSTGSFEKYEEVSGTHMRDVILERGGQGTPTHACMPGCIIRCSNRYPGPDGKVLHAPMEFETNALLGPNLGISDLDTIAQLAYVATDLGLDTIELGAALGVAMKAGAIPWGDRHAIQNVLEEIRQGGVLGRVVACGAATAGRVLGVADVPVVKGQSMAGYDPRALKGMGVTYATSPMGADHTAGSLARVKTDQLDPSDKVAMSRNAQIEAVLWDMLGVCQFAAGAFRAMPDLASSLVNARFGSSISPSDLRTIAIECIRTELQFNREAGLTALDDRIPEFMTKRPLPPNNSVFDVTNSQLDECWTTVVEDGAQDTLQTSRR